MQALVRLWLHNSYFCSFFFYFLTSSYFSPPITSTYLHLYNSNPFHHTILYLPRQALTSFLLLPNSKFPSPNFSLSLSLSFQTNYSFSFPPIFWPPLPSSLPYSTLSHLPVPGSPAPVYALYCHLFLYYSLCFPPTTHPFLPTPIHLLLFLLHCLTPILLSRNHFLPFFLQLLHPCHNIPLYFLISTFRSLYNSTCCLLLQHDFFNSHLPSTYSLSSFSSFHLSPLYSSPIL